MPVTGISPRFMPMLTKVWNISIDVMPMATYWPKVSRDARHAHHTVEEQQEDQEKRQPSEEAEHAHGVSEDEVGVAHAQELVLALDAAVQAVPEPAARADGDVRLDDVEARAEIVAVGVVGHQQAVLLIVVQDELPGDEARRDRRQRHAQEVDHPRLRKQ